MRKERAHRGDVGRRSRGGKEGVKRMPIGEKGGKAAEEEFQGEHGDRVKEREKRRERRVSIRQIEQERHPRRRLRLLSKCENNICTIIFSLVFFLEPIKESQNNGKTATSPHFQPH